MKKKQVALLLAALMCITSVAESAAVMGAEFSSGEETVEMQGTEEFWYGRSARSGRIYIRRIRGIDRRSRC